MSLSRLLKPVIAVVYQCVADYRAYNHKRQSQRALYFMDDHLLNDIGLTRFEGQIVPLETSVHHSKTVRNRESQSRLRRAYLIRKQRYLRVRGAVG